MRSAQRRATPGRGDGAFAPSARLRRDQAAAMLARGLNRLAATYGPHTP